MNNKEDRINDVMSNFTKLKEDMENVALRLTNIQQTNEVIDSDVTAEQMPDSMPTPLAEKTSAVIVERELKFSIEQVMRHANAVVYSALMSSYNVLPYVIHYPVTLLHEDVTPPVVTNINVELLLHIRYKKVVHEPSLGAYDGMGDLTSMLSACLMSRVPLSQVLENITVTSKFQMQLDKEMEKQGRDYLKVKFNCAFSLPCSHNATEQGIVDSEED